MQILTQSSQRYIFQTNYWELCEARVGTKIEFLNFHCNEIISKLIWGIALKAISLFIVRQLAVVVDILFLDAKYDKNICNVN